jgi:hypothetical protein
VAKYYPVNRRKPTSETETKTTTTTATTTENKSDNTATDYDLAVDALTEALDDTDTIAELNEINCSGKNNATLDDTGSVALSAAEILTGLADPEIVERIRQQERETATLTELLEWRNANGAGFLRRADGSIWVTHETGLSDALRAVIVNNQSMLAAFVPTTATTTATTTTTTTKPYTKRDDPWIMSANAREVRTPAKPKRITVLPPVTETKRPADADVLLTDEEFLADCNPHKHG